MALKPTGTTTCPQCRTARLPHTACPSCGYYKRAGAVEIKSAKTAE
jgi:ribosomal protein L32